MPLSISNNSKNNLSISNDSKADNTTWAEHIETWAEAGPGGATWAAPGVPLTKDTKNNLSITNTAKN